MDTLVYGDALGSLVFLREIRAKDLAQVQDLLRSDPTWGTFRNHVSLRIKKETDDWFESERPTDEESFSLPWLAEDWPYPHQEQFEFLPGDVVELGANAATMVSGDRLGFPYAAEVEAVRRLRAHGFEVRRDDDLVRCACGDSSASIYQGGS